VVELLVFLPQTGAEMLVVVLQNLAIRTLQTGAEIRAVVVPEHTNAHVVITTSV